MAQQLLLIEAPSGLVDESLTSFLTGEAGYRVERADWETLRLDALARCTARMIVADTVAEHPKATDFFRWLGEHRITIPTFAVLSHAPGEQLLRRVAESADDFTLRPVRKEELRHRLARLLGPEPSSVEAVRQRLTEEMGLAQLVGNAPAFTRVIEQIPRIAHSGAPVLITGETGTGKELCARAIHHLGPRRNSPFIAVDCGTIPDHLFENEMFGHTRGAYTDAHRDQRGLVALAEGGTLFLDEIDVLSQAAQGKLLRFLQEREFRPLGSDRFQAADVNVLAATNRDLQAAVDNRQFRADLFYRLNVLRLHLPALRDRAGDIGILATHFLAQSRGRDGLGRRLFSESALRLLAQHDWPGNIRELANVVQRAAVLCEGRDVLARHVILPRPKGDVAEVPMPFRAARAAAVAAFERRYIQELLDKHGGNVTRSAQEAGKDRRVFGRLMKKHGITR